MSKSSLKISDAEMQALRQATATTRRSLAGQAEHWMRLGREVEQRGSGRLHPDVIDALHGQASVDELPLDLQEAYFDELSAAMKTPTPQEEAFFAAMRARGGAVGWLSDDSDEMVTLPPGA